MGKTKIILLLLFFCKVSLGQEIVINEFMSSNGSAITDDFGDESDWIELCNSSTVEINLFQWHLSDNDTLLNKWQFPDTTVLPGQFLLIFCSGRDTISDYFHTSFKIKSSGESLCLSGSNQLIMDYFDPVVLGNNVSFGRTSDGGPNTTSFFVSSPGESNDQNIPLNEVMFSHSAGFYDQDVQIELFSQNSGGDIYYTVNGNDPIPGTSYSYSYNNTLSLQEIQNLPVVYSYIPTTPEDNCGYFEWEYPNAEVEKHVVIKARTFEDSQPSSKCYTKSFFIGEDIFSRFSLPVMSITSDSISLFCEDTGIFVPGTRHIPGILKTGNYCERGSAWERPGTIELFSTDGELLYEKELGLRIHGNQSRSAPNKAIQYFLFN